MWSTFQVDTITIWWCHTSTKNSNNWAYIACTDSKVYSWMVCVEFLECLQQHFNRTCNWKSPMMISSKPEPDMSAVMNSLQLSCQESLTSNHRYCVATVMLLILQGHSSCIRWHTVQMHYCMTTLVQPYMVPPSPWGTKHLHHYTISFPYRRLL